jgi:hypothetical protein
MKIDGACHCGFIAYEAEVDPNDTGLCHCTDCQTLSGSPFRASVPAAHENFRLLSGKPAIYVKTAESGSKRLQAFCPKCGSPIYSTAPDNPHAAYNIRVGSVRQRDLLVPRDQVWARSAQLWIDSIAAIPKFEKEDTD